MAAPQIEPHITRQAIREILRHWQRGEVNAVMVLEWADIHVNHPDAQYADQEQEGSVAHEILLMLSCLDMHWVTVDDMPWYLELLDTPAGRFLDGWRKFCERLEGVDMEARRRQLKDDPLYHLGAGKDAEPSGEKDLF
ncbi:MAG: hypothetical protein AABY83_04870 [Pseudomonadota bacterium]